MGAGTPEWVLHPVLQHCTPSCSVAPIAAWHPVQNCTHRGVVPIAALTSFPGCSTLPAELHPSFPQHCTLTGCCTPSCSIAPIATLHPSPGAAPRMVLNPPRVLHPLHPSQGAVPFLGCCSLPRVLHPSRLCNLPECCTHCTRLGCHTFHGTAPNPGCCIHCIRPGVLYPSRGAAPIMVLHLFWGAAPIEPLHPSHSAAPIMPLHPFRGAAAFPGCCTHCTHPGVLHPSWGAHHGIATSQGAASIAPIPMCCTLLMVLHPAWSCPLSGCCTHLRVLHPSRGAAPTARSPSPRSPPEAPDTIELELRTDSAEGLLLWHGAVSRGTPAGRGPQGGGQGAPHTPTVPAGAQQGRQSQRFHRPRLEGWTPGVQVSGDTQCHPRVPHVTQGCSPH